MESELLSVNRLSGFIAFCMEHDLQVLAHRREAAGLFRTTLARFGDHPTLEWSSDKYDKVLTFLSQNDLQVHYAGADKTVGVYAIVKLIGELRRKLRDHPQQPLADVDLPLMSPRGSALEIGSPRNQASTGRPPVPPLDLARGLFQPSRDKGPSIAEASRKPSDQ